MITWDEGGGVYIQTQNQTQFFLKKKLRQKREYIIYIIFRGGGAGVRECVQLIGNLKNESNYVGVLAIAGFFSIFPLS